MRQSRHDDSKLAWSWNKAGGVPTLAILFPDLSPLIVLITVVYKANDGFFWLYFTSMHIGMVALFPAFPAPSICRIVCKYRNTASGKASG